MNMKNSKLAPSVFSLDEIQTILSSFTDSVSGIRNQALVATMFAAGLRVSEAISLMPSDIDKAKNEVLIRNGKGGKTRRVGLLLSLIPYLDRWLEKRKSLGFNGKEPIFCTHTKGSVRKQSGEAISADYVRGFLARLQSKLDLDKRLHSHAFRHSLASLLMERNQNLSTISAQLGHCSTSTTDRYLKSIRPEELCNAMAAIEVKISPPN
jgi:site-specific recombinase XerD